MRLPDRKDGESLYSPLASLSMEQFKARLRKTVEIRTERPPIINIPDMPIKPCQELQISRPEPKFYFWLEC